MKKTIKKHKTKKCDNWCSALLLAVTVLLTACICVFSSSLGKNEVYYTYIPTLGAVAKAGGNDNFYYADSVKGFEGENYELLDFFAYFDENKGCIDVNFSVKCTGDNEAFVQEYGALYTPVEETQEMKTLSGKKLKKLMDSCRPRVFLKNGELEGDTVRFCGSYKYSLGDRQFELATRHLKITFEFKEKVGFTTFKKIAKRFNVGNGISLFLADGSHCDSTGVFALIESDGSTIPQEDITEKTDIKFFDSEGREIIKNIFPREEETAVFESAEETPYYFFNISLDDISAVKLVLSGTRVNKTAPIDLFSDTVFGNHFIYSGSYLRIVNVKIVDDGITFNAEALCDNELSRDGTIVFEAGFKENGKVPFITDLKTGKSEERVTLCRADGEKEFKIELRSPQKVKKCIIFGGVLLEYTATVNI